MRTESASFWASIRLRRWLSASLYFSASSTMRLISSSLKPPLLCSTMLCSLPVALSFADTFTMPFASMSKVTWSADRGGTSAQRGANSRSRNAGKTKLMEEPVKNNDNQASTTGNEWQPSKPTSEQQMSRTSTYNQERGGVPSGRSRWVRSEPIPRFEAHHEVLEECPRDRTLPASCSPRRCHARPGTP